MNWACGFCRHQSYSLLGHYLHLAATLKDFDGHIKLLRRLGHI